MDRKLQSQLSIRAKLRMFLLVVVLFTGTFSGFYIVCKFQLVKSQEKTYDQVYEIDLHGAHIGQIANLDKVHLFSSFFL